MKRIRMILLVILPAQLLAQEQFIFEGRIEYERRINLHRQIDPSEDESWLKAVLPTVPNFHTSNFTLLFNKDEAIYKPEGEIAPVTAAFLFGPAKENIVLTEFNKATKTSYKSVFEKRYRIEDSIKAMKWRVTNEKRTIAGLECRKAVTIICDSVYVAAFYAEEIPVSGGPESFAGLPGMILGVAIPRLHTTWFATKVVLSPPAVNEFATKNRGEKINDAGLENTLKSSLGDWGKYGERNIWWILL